jgi:hypothetical protein
MSLIELNRRGLLSSRFDSYGYARHALRIDGGRYRPGATPQRVRERDRDVGRLEVGPEDSEGVRRRGRYPGTGPTIRAVTSATHRRALLPCSADRRR